MRRLCQSRCSSRTLSRSCWAQSSSSAKSKAPTVLCTLSTPTLPHSPSTGASPLLGASSNNSSSRQQSAWKKGSLRTMGTDTSAHKGGSEGWARMSSILGLSQAMVDFTASVPDTFLEECKVAKGSRRVISLQERHEVIDGLDQLGCSSTVSPGGSVANTLVAVARLSAANGGPPVRVSMAGSVGEDALGCYFNAQMRKAGVNMLVDPLNPSHTGTVMVLTTPDAQRSFLSFFDNGELKLTPHLIQAIANNRMVVIEGYMLEVPGAQECLRAVASLARDLGVQVALTAGDPGVVERHRGTMQSLMSSGLVDVLFCNREEASALLQGAGPNSFGGRLFTPTPNKDSRSKTHSKARSEACETPEALRCVSPPLNTHSMHSTHSSISSSIDSSAGLSAAGSDVSSGDVGGAVEGVGVQGAARACGCGCQLGLVHACLDGALCEGAHSVQHGVQHSAQASSAAANNGSGSSGAVSGGDVSNNNNGSVGAREWSAEEAVVAIAGHVPVVIVTDGTRGSCVGVHGQVHQLGPHLVSNPVDVCGAGDAFAAGILFAMMQGHDLRTAGQFAARAAAAVVSRHGAQLSESDALELVQHLPKHVLLREHWPSSSSLKASGIPV